MRSRIKSIVKDLVKEVLKEMTVTGDVAGYNIPGAFSKKGQKHNKATEYTQKMGYTIAKLKNRKFEESNPEELTEDVQYNASNDVNGLKQALSKTENDVESKYIQSIKQKFLGKDVTIQGSKGYGQFKSKYSLKVMDVTIQDWYGKDDYQLIFTGEDKKQYFVDVSVPVTILSQKPKTVTPPASPATTTRSATTPSLPAGAAAQTPTPLSQQITK